MIISNISSPYTRLQMNFKCDSFRERVAQNQMRFKIVLSDVQNEQQLNLK